MATIIIAENVAKGLGGDVLPGFALPVRDIFAELERHGSIS